MPLSLTVSLETPGAFLADREDQIHPVGMTLYTGTEAPYVIRCEQPVRFPEARSRGGDRRQQFLVLNGRLAVHLLTFFERGQPLLAWEAVETAMRPRADWPAAVDWFTERVLLDARRPQLLDLAAPTLYWVEGLHPGTLFLSTDSFRPDPLRPALKRELIQSYFG